MDYRKQYRRVIYANFFTNGRLNAYLADIDRQTQERFEWLMEDMKQAQSIVAAEGKSSAVFLFGEICLNNV